jgi:hypothetical protein
VSGVRRAWLDVGPGEARGLVTLDGRPERLLVVRDGDQTPRLGQRFGARVEAVSARLGLARLDLGGQLATLRLRGGAPPAVGARLSVEVTAEPVRGKPAAVRLIADAPPSSSGPLEPPASVEAQLAALGFTLWETGDDARERLDEAEAEACAREHEVGQGVTLVIEPTRALTAVDVDLAETGAPASVARANVLAVVEAARLLRLKAIGGLVAIDLVGFPKDVRGLMAQAREAFAPDGGEVVLAPPSRFGVLELSKPNARQPLHEHLLDPNGRPSPRTVAQAVVRALERQGRFDPGGRLVAACAPEVAAAATLLVAALGPRFSVRAEVGRARSAYDIRTP